LDDKLSSSLELFQISYQNGKNYMNLVFCRGLQDEPGKGGGEMNCNYVSQGAIPKASSNIHRSHSLNPMNAESFKTSDDPQNLVRKY
jgi:hypothetical protein